MSRILRKAVVGAAALAAFTAVGVPTAHAADYYTHCGTTQYNFGLIATTACFARWGIGTTIVHAGKWRHANYSNPNDWTDCDMHIALHVNNVQTRKTIMPCLHAAQNPNFNDYIHANPTWGPSPDYCYKAVVWWTAVYQGNFVTSQNTAYSTVLCW